MSPIRILFLGDVVGEPGRRAVIARLKPVMVERAIDFAVINGENAAGGKGITPKIAIDLLRAGAAVITSGDHIWDQAEVIPYFETEPRLLRPLNYPPGLPGAGSVVLDTDKGPVAVINAQGRTFMHQAAENPFLALEAEVARLRDQEGVKVIVVDFHAEATSEKIAVGWLLDGKVSLVAGTHTHVQTADERILPQGTAFICDAGMCGPLNSVLGRRAEAVVERFRTTMPARFPVAPGPVALCGVIADIDPETGHALAVERFHENGH
jgi:2',3'-cyclic-nucleotide 2'-phosphodiesterase